MVLLVLFFFVGYVVSVKKSLKWSSVEIQEDALSLLLSLFLLLRHPLMFCKMCCVKKLWKVRRFFVILLM